MTGKKELPFVTEQIKKGSKMKRWLLKAAKAMILAIVFGVTAGVSFALVLAFVQQNGKEEDDLRESITIPRDTQPLETEPKPTLPLTAETTPAESSEPIENIVENVLSERSFTIEDYTALYDTLYEVVSTVNQSIVTVTTSESKLDWFDNTYEMKDEASGLIYNKTDSEMLILTDAESIQSADHIWVTFRNGKEYEATLRKADPVSGLAVLVIDAELLGDDLTGYPVASLGNSYTVKQGDVAITVGNPLGYNYSMSYGVVSSVKNVAQAVDVNYHLIHTNIPESSMGGGFLINTKGEVMGIITKTYKSEAANGITTAISISDLKGVLEKLSNEQEIAYFGIKGQDVTADIAKETGLPEGIYVSETIAGSPVYQAGVQSGDILVEFGGVQVYSMKIFRNLLESRKPEEEVAIKVMRKGREEYVEIEFDVSIGMQ